MAHEDADQPRWRGAAGLLVAAALVGLLVGRATGVLGGESDIFATDSSVAGSDPTAAASPSAPGSVTTAGPTGRGGKKRDVPQALATDVPGGDELAQRVEDLLGEQESVEPTTFRVSSFNVLGASHTSAGGNKPQYASGSDRMRGTVSLLSTLDLDVVGLQEFELVQYHALKRLTGDRYGVYPGPALGRGPIRNSVIWRQDTWELVDARTIPIPYFRGNRVPMPYVLLKHRESGQGVYFINIHNPTSNARRGNNERWRDLGTTMETTLANRLNRDAGVPVVLMGDFNEREEAFCRVTGAGLVAANGGNPGRPCSPPAGAGIDWIFGTRDITFSDYLRLDSPLVDRVTDHPVIAATARVGG